MRIFLALAIMALALAMPCAASAADSSSIDRKYEAAKAPDQRRMIAAELESALIRLRLEANSAAMRK